MGKHLKPSGRLDVTLKEEPVYRTWTLLPIGQARGLKLLRAVPFEAAFLAEWGYTHATTKKLNSTVVNTQSGVTYELIA